MTRPFARLEQAIRVLVPWRGIQVALTGTEPVR